MCNFYVNLTMPNPCADGWPTFSRDTGGFAALGALSHGAGLDVFQERGCHLAWIATNHPGGGTGYRIEHAGRSVVYLTDNELEPAYEKATSFAACAAFCRHTNVLIHDAQYLPE